MTIIFRKNTFIRTSPSDLDQPPVGIHYKGTVLKVDNQIYKGATILNNSNWYKDDQGFYFWSGGVKPWNDKMTFNHPVPVYQPISEWGIEKILLEKNMPTGQSINIALLDSGVDLNHPDLRNVVVAYENFCGGDIEDVTDNTGTGTQRALKIAGHPPWKTKCIAPNAKLFIAKIKDDHHISDINHLLFALDWITTNDVDIIVIGDMIDAEKLFEKDKIALDKLIDFAEAKGIEIVWPKRGNNK